ncbi:MAG: hypothetical protein ABR936_11920 [Bacteroidota bacterium]|jgi:hypothetical protein
MRKYFVLILSVFVCLQLYAGGKSRHITSEKWINSTHIDSVLFSTSGQDVTHLTITADSLPGNRLRFRTNLDVTAAGAIVWRTLGLNGDAAYTYPATGGTYIYRTSDHDSVYSRVWGD